ncbi:MAG: hypothetical protein WCL00_01195 [Bacteroidota bacterium]
MRLFKLFSLIAFLSLLVFVNACKVTYPNEKLLIGKWTPVKVEKYIDAGIVAPSAGTPAKRPNASSASKPAMKGDSTSATGVAGSGKSQEELMQHQLSKMSTAMERTTLEVFKEKKMAVLYNPRTTIKGNWKLKKKGTQINVKELVSGRKFIIDIVKITDTTAEMINRYPFGDVKVFYHRDPK